MNDCEELETLYSLDDCLSTLTPIEEYAVLIKPTKRRNRSNLKRQINASKEIYSKPQMKFRPMSQRKIQQQMELKRQEEQKQLAELNQEIDRQKILEQARALEHLTKINQELERRIKLEQKLEQQRKAKQARAQQKQIERVIIQEKQIELVQENKEEAEKTYLASIKIPLMDKRWTDAKRYVCKSIMDLPIQLDIRIREMYIQGKNVQLPNHYFDHLKADLEAIRVDTLLSTSILANTCIRHVHCQDYIIQENDRVESIIAENVEFTHVSSHIHYLQCSLLLTNVNVESTSLQILDVKYYGECLDSHHNVPILTLRKIHSRTIDKVPARVKYLRLVGHNIQVSDQVYAQCKVYIYNPSDNYARYRHKFWFH